MCRSPVTLGSGSAITYGSRPESGTPPKTSAASHRWKMGPSAVLAS